ncbi:MAG: FG-GAP-like repeat-containing protein [Myxococcota bacterium]
MRSGVKRVSLLGLAMVLAACPGPGTGTPDETTGTDAGISRVDGGGGGGPDAATANDAGETGDAGASNGDDAGTLPSTDGGTQPGDDAGTPPGDDAGTSSDHDGGLLPGDDAGTWSDNDGGTPSGADAGFATDGGEADAGNTVFEEGSTAPVTIRAHVIANVTQNATVQFTSGLRREESTSFLTNSDGIAVLSAVGGVRGIVTACGGTFTNEADGTTASLGDDCLFAAAGEVFDQMMAADLVLPAEPATEIPVVLTPFTTILTSCKSNPLGALLPDGTGWDARNAGVTSLTVRDSNGQEINIQNTNALLAWLLAELGAVDLTQLPPNILSLVPVDFSNPANALAIQAARDSPEVVYGLLVAAFSQAGVDLNAGPLGYMDALRKDFQDCRFDGYAPGDNGIAKVVTLPGGAALPNVYGTMRLAAENFLAGPQNASGTTAADFTALLTLIEMGEYEPVTGAPPTVEVFPLDNSMVATGCVPIYYTLNQNAGQRVDVMVEYRFLPDQVVPPTPEEVSANWGDYLLRATQAGAPPNTTINDFHITGTYALDTLTDGPQGHLFYWNALHDIPRGYNENTVACQYQYPDGPLERCRYEGSLLIGVRAIINGQRVGGRHIYAQYVDFNRAENVTCPEATGSVVNLEGGTRGQAAVAGDFNGDGKHDIAVVADAPGNSLVQLGGHGDGQFSVRSLPLSGAPTDVAAADIDLDGFQDVVVLSGSGALLFYRGGPDGLAFSTETAAEAGGTMLALGDINGDLRPDVSVIYPSRWVRLFQGHGDGTFTERAAPATPGTPSDVGMGDLDGNGTDEVVVVHSDSDTLMGLEIRNGTLLIHVADRTRGTGLAVGHLYGENTYDRTIMEVLVARADGAAVQWTGTVVDPYTHVIGDAFNSFVYPGQDLATTGFIPTKVAVATFAGNMFGANGPGYSNHHEHRKIAAISTANDTMLVFKFDIYSYGYVLDETIPVGDEPVDVVALDANHDGIPDLATVNRAGGSVTVVLGTKADDQ